ncbi:hypothetical protein ACFYQ5_01370 [Streptomyces sp. NPDC005794]|uniref:hypothetical protein n=1 Tax=Streptomyces sp. NPDC005794 TaxID=3364733 RepID=UPI00368F79CB
MRALLQETGTAGLSFQDIPPEFREVVERGWSSTPAGGRVLTDLLPENLPEFSDRLAEETTVNGRGMTDYDLSSATDERAPLLVRRCLAYVAACLHGAQKHFGDTAVKGYVSFSLRRHRQGTTDLPRHLLHPAGIQLLRPSRPR